MVLPPTGASPYETWVLTLRAWARDPRTPLDQLPRLEVETFTPVTYARFLDHFRAAQEAVVERWSTALLDLVRRARTTAELAAGLVDLRNTLARSVQLVSHPALPPEIRGPLTQQNRESIERYQREFEEGIAKSARSGHLLSGEADRILALVREHSFVAVLDREMRWDGEQLSAAPLPPTAPAGRAAPPPPGDGVANAGRRSYRRVTLLGE